jgi:hypothetical protein
MQPSGRTSLATGFPPRICESMISSTSLTVTRPYQTASGYTTTVGPCSHCSRHPDLLARTLVPAIPRAARVCLKKACNSPFVSGSQLPRGFPKGRWLPQTNICFSNFAIIKCTGFSSPIDELKLSPVLIPRLWRISTTHTQSGKDATAIPRAHPKNRDE